MVSPAALLAHQTGALDSLPRTWCKKCQADVKPEGKGVCPRCKTFLSLNFVARRRPVNVLRRQQLLDKLVADYRPHTTLLQSSCEMLAGILEQLEALKPGSTEHQRLVQLSQLLGAALEESRTARVASLPTDFANMTEDQLIERQEAMLRDSYQRREMKRQSDAYLRNVSARVITPPSPEPVTPEPTHETPPPAPARCQYCYQTTDACEAMRTQRPEIFAALHHASPEMVSSVTPRPPP